MLSCHYEDFMTGIFTNPYLNGALKTYEKSVIVNNLIKLNTYNCSKTLWTDHIFCFQCNNGILLPKLFWPTVRKIFANSRPSALNFKKLSWSLEQFIQTVKGQNNFVNKIPFLFIFSQTNKKVVYVIKNGQMKEVLAEDISVGDLIYLEDNDMIPCDMVVLSTSQVESFQDFLIRLYMKSCIDLVEISIFH